jgi:hypothetical protein
LINYAYESINLRWIINLSTTTAQKQPNLQHFINKTKIRVGVVLNPNCEIGGKKKKTHPK